MLVTTLLQLILAVKPDVTVLVAVVETVDDIVLVKDVEPDDEAVLEMVLLAELVNVKDSVLDIVEVAVVAVSVAVLLAVDDAVDVPEVLPDEVTDDDPDDDADDVPVVLAVDEIELVTDDVADRDAVVDSVLDAVLEPDDDAVVLGEVVIDVFSQPKKLPSAHKSIAPLSSEAKSLHTAADVNLTFLNRHEGS